ncbi:DUF4145 domain-containing protein [Arthrobacter globiformis]|uniref:DUF4145 domain-containing protein n=1 Tax=Arthrobacter globiformis TaxID=1665 RepID=UPI00397AA199
MAVNKCGWCGNSTHMTVFGNGRVAEGTGSRAWLIETPFSCDQCLRLSVGSGEFDVQPTTASMESMKNFWNNQQPQKWHPTFVEGQVFSDVPQHIAEAAGEAHKSFSIGNLKSTILMARTVVEATAKNKEITSGTLFHKIDALAAANIIQDFTKTTAHAIRSFGNDMAHGDIELPVDQEDANMVLEFMDALLAEVFQNPAKLAALQARVAARANG